MVNIHVSEDIRDEYLSEALTHWVPHAGKETFHIAAVRARCLICLQQHGELLMDRFMKRQYEAFAQKHPDAAEEIDKEAQRLVPKQADVVPFMQAA